MRHKEVLQAHLNTHINPEYGWAWLCNPSFRALIPWVNAFFARNLTFPLLLEHDREGSLFSLQGKAAFFLSKPYAGPKEFCLLPAPTQPELACYLVCNCRLAFNDHEASGKNAVWLGLRGLLPGSPPKHSAGALEHKLPIRLWKISRNCPAIHIHWQA